MSNLVFPNRESMSINDLRQMITALYRDDQGWRILLRTPRGKSGSLDISEESGTAVHTAVTEDGNAGISQHDFGGDVGMATLWALKPNAYGRLLTRDEQGQMAELYWQLTAVDPSLANPRKLQPRGRNLRVMGVM